MPKYKYTAVNADGDNISDTVYASDAAEFNAILKQKNEFCVKYKEIADEEGTGRVTTASIKMKDLSVFCKQFATMLNSGITIVKSLDVLYRQAEKEKMKNILLKVYEQVQVGKGLSEAMRSVEGAFPEFMLSMVEAGEMSGSLELVMERLAGHYEKEVKLKNKVTSAMIYPILLCVVGFGVVMILFTFVMPQLMGMFDQDTLPGITKVLFAISDAIRFHFIPILCVVGFIILTVTVGRTLKPVKMFMDRLKISAPAIGKLYTKIIAASFCRTMSSVFSSGMSLITSLELTSNCLNNMYITKRMDAVIDEIRAGGALSASLTKLDIFPQMMVTMINVGEESGALDTILEKTSDFYDMEADDAIQKLVSMLEPAMIIVLGGIVGVVVIGIMAPIYGMYSNVGNG